MTDRDEYTIRTAVPEDLDQVVQVEAACFPAAEAADRESSVSYTHLCLQTARFLTMVSEIINQARALS